MRPLVETTLADLHGQLAGINLTTCFLCCREGVRAIRSSGHRGGRIVNVASRAGELPVAGMAAYVTTKAAVIGLTRAVAAEVLEDGILVNAISPSTIDTEANRRAMPAADTSRWPRPPEIADTVLDLISPRNTLTSGAVVPVYGHA